MKAISARAACWKVLPTESVIRAREKRRLTPTFTLSSGDEEIQIDVLLHLRVSHIRCEGGKKNHF